MDLETGSAIAGALGLLGIILKKARPFIKGLKAMSEAVLGDGNGHEPMMDKLDRIDRRTANTDERLFRVEGRVEDLEKSIPAYLRRRRPPNS